jgi:hypothetical protein
MARERSGRLQQRRKKPQGESLYRFDWPVDQEGYDIVPVSDGTGKTLVERATYGVIRARGGPLRFYRPMEDEPGLWREFAETCTSPQAALNFTIKFGELLQPDSPADKSPSASLRAAELLRQLVELIDSFLGAPDDKVRSKRLPEAIEFFNSKSRAETVGWIDSNGELRPYPANLRSALWIQAGEALTRKQTFAHCQNPQCSTWFRVGTGASTIRRKFCSDRCRVAVDRAKAKQR